MHLYCDNYHLINSINDLPPLFLFDKPFHRCAGKIIFKISLHRFWLQNILPGKIGKHAFGMGFACLNIGQYPRKILLLQIQHPHLPFAFFSPCRLQRPAAWAMLSNPLKARITQAIEISTPASINWVLMQITGSPFFRRALMVSKIALRCTAHWWVLK